METELLFFGETNTVFGIAPATIAMQFRGV